MSQELFLLFQELFCTQNSPYIASGGYQSCPVVRWIVFHTNKHIRTSHSGK